MLDLKLYLNQAALNVHSVYIAWDYAGNSINDNAWAAYHVDIVDCCDDYGKSLKIAFDGMDLTFGGNKFSGVNKPDLSNFGKDGVSIDVMITEWRNTQYTQTSFIVE